MMLLSIIFGLSAKAQSQAFSPVEGATHSYTWNGLQEGVEYDFYMTTKANIDIEPYSIQSNKFEFTTSSSGVVASGESTATIGVEWNEGAAAYSFYLWIKVTSDKGCSNYRYVNINPQENKRSFMFNEIASSDCFNANDNKFLLSFRVKEADGVDISKDCFPITVNYTVNGTAYSESIEYENQNITISESMMESLNPMQNSEITVVAIGVTDVKGASIPGLNKVTHTHTIFALPVIEFTAELIKKYKLNINEEFITYNNIIADRVLCIRTE